MAASSESLDQPAQRIRRVFSHPLILAVCVAASGLLIYLIELHAPPWIAELLVDSARASYPFTVQNVMWVVFAVGIGEIIVRARDAIGEAAELKAGYLPEDERTILQAPELRRIYLSARNATLSARRARRFMPRLIHRVVAQFQISRSAEQANALLNSSLELFLHEIDLRYSMIRYVVWLIPTLGFIGTVIGISLALTYAASADVKDPTLLAELTKRLAVAFNTTLMALVMAAILVAAQHIVQAREEGALNRVGQYCLDNLINRLYEE